ncbi:hypothetical protein HK104_008558 [Borealophlyctis nickersoniae]|nr:hypothetical protein HK104_008558 [Borealophlyctis nickersoniae]
MAVPPISPELRTRLKTLYFEDDADLVIAETMLAQYRINTLMRYVAAQREYMARHTGALVHLRDSCKPCTEEYVCYALGSEG